MQCATAFIISALAASTFAAPAAQRCRPGRDVNVILSNSAIELGSTTTFCEQPVLAGPRTKDPIGSTGPFSTVELSLGDAVGKQDLRCQILDSNGLPIVVVRGANVDVTFADGGNGPWTFQEGDQEVSQIICDATFVAGEALPPAPPNYDTEDPASSTLCDKSGIFCVELSDGATWVRTHFVEAGSYREEREPFGEPRPYNSVALLLSQDINNQALRCQILDPNGQPITVQRGANVDTTFADGGNGPWAFLEPAQSVVSSIVCDPAFVTSA